MALKLIKLRIHYKHLAPNGALLHGLVNPKLTALNTVP